MAGTSPSPRGRIGEDARRCRCCGSLLFCRPSARRWPSGSGTPDTVLADSARAVETHPDVLLMPTAFLVVEWSGADEAWTPASGLLVSAHDARRTLDFTLTWWRPRHQGLIPYDAGPVPTGRRLNSPSPSTPQTDYAPATSPGPSRRHPLPDRTLPPPAAPGPRRTRRPTPVRHQHAPPEALHPRLGEDGTVHAVPTVRAVSGGEPAADSLRPRQTGEGGREAAGLEARMCAAFPVGVLRGGPGESGCHVRHRCTPIGSVGAVQKLPERPGRLRNYLRLTVPVRIRWSEHLPESQFSAIASESAL
ncbi:hypothetical protein K4902_35805 (plasmid) [Streptomyces lateritius]|nr:hypothetical protein [Streptomyces lateritius]